MVGLLAIGFSGGFFTHLQLTRHHLEQIKKEATIPGFKERLFHVIGAGEEQRKQLEPIVNKYAERMGQVHSDIRIQRKNILDSLRQELSPQLSAKQMKRLERFAHRHLMPPPHKRKKMQGQEKMPH